MAMRALLFFLGWMVFVPTVAAQDTLYFENFDSVVAPEAPVGWTLGDGWATDAGVQSSGSGENNLRHNGNSTEAADTPTIDLSGATGAVLSYLARRTSSYDAANLRVLASVDGGATFPTVLIPAGTAVGGTSYDSIGVALPASMVGSPSLVIRFEGFGLNTSSSNARIDDITLTSTTEPPPPDPSALAFATAASQANSGDAGIQIPLRLELHPEEGLQGLQFRATWDVTGLHLIDVIRGSAVADAVNWTLDYEAADQQVDVVLLGQGTSSIAQGTYDPILTLVFDSDPAEVTQIGAVRLQSVVGALAGPEAGDARVFPGDDHSLTLTGGQASIAVSSTSLDFGMVEAGTVDSMLLTISNPDGEMDLEINSIASSNPLFGIQPTSANIPSSGSAEFYVTFAPSFTEFGRQTGELVIHHNADGDSTIVHLTAKGHSGRGDADGDGMVDALDVVHAMDFILGRLMPAPVQVTASDLFPFPAGDLAIDVRDLTVLTQAIAHGQWPDDVSLPIEEAPTSLVASGMARVVISPGSDEQTDVHISHDVPLRSFQIVFASDRDISKGIQIEGMSTVSGYDARRGEVRVLAYKPDGSAVAPGTLAMSVSGEIGLPRFTSAVDDQRRRIRVDASVSTSSRHPDEAETFRLVPYPNPYRPAGGSLTLGLKARVQVFDLLGREVFSADEAEQWDGRDQSGGFVAPGLYIIRTDDGEERQSRTVTVIR